VVVSLQSSGHRERGFLDLRTPWADACDVSDFNNPSTYSHSDDSGGAAVLVPPRTPRNSGMIFCAHAIYVVICYMSVICYMPVICLVQSLPQEAVVVEGPFLVSRTGCAPLSCTMYRRAISGKQNWPCARTPCTLIGACAQVYGT
jgi:hypothetical protein